MSRAVSSALLPILFQLMLAACEGEIEVVPETPAPPADPHDQSDPDEALYWDIVIAETSSSAFYAVDGFGEDELYLAGEAGTLHLWDGTELELVETLMTAQGEAPNLNALWTWSDGQGRLMFVAGDLGAIFRYRFDEDGFERLETNTRSAFKAIFGMARDDVWAVGDGGIYRFDGEQWARDVTTPGNPKLYAIWGDVDGDQDDLYAVGRTGVVLHRIPDADGAGGYYWETVSLGLGEDLHNVWGPGDGTVFVVGQEGLILHFDGSAWVTQQSGTFEHLWTVRGVSGTQVFAAGTNGAVLFYNGEGWQHIAAPTHKNLYGLWGNDVRAVYSAGAWSTLIRFDNDPAPPPIAEDE